MSFPAPSLPVPALSTYQMSYGGLAFAGVVTNATYQLQEYPEGLDTPDYLTGDIQKALDEGEWAGLDLSPGRNILVKQVIRGVTAVGLDEARQALAGVLGPKGVVEEPLYLQMPSGVFACLARPRKHKAPFDITAVLAKGAIASTMFHATDPRWYAMPSKTATVGIPAATGGVIFPTTFPVTFTGGGTAGVIEAENDGLMEMRPVFIVTGPCVNPKIACVSLPGSPAIQFDLVLNAGDQLTIDTDTQSVALTTAGSTEGSSRRTNEAPGSIWFNFPPGPNTVKFTTEDTTRPAGTLTVQWADAYMGL
jgi:hypothetical protein